VWLGSDESLAACACAALHTSQCPGRHGKPGLGLYLYPWAFY